MKGVIIAAGYGTRFLPVTKTIPKEMLPLVDKPAIDFIVEEFVQSGINDILIVTSRRKKSLDDYFDRETELESNFYLKSDFENLSKIAPVNANIYFVRQKSMLGTGNAILSCKGFVGDSPFVVAYPDDIVFSKIPLAKQLIDIYNETGKNVLAVEKKESDLSRYGVISYENDNNLQTIIANVPIGTPYIAGEADMYIVGDMNDWKIVEEFKMSSFGYNVDTDATNAAGDKWMNILAGRKYQITLTNLPQGTKYKYVMVVNETAYPEVDANVNTVPDYVLGNFRATSDTVKYWKGITIAVRLSNEL